MIQTLPFNQSVNLVSIWLFPVAVLFLFIFFLNNSGISDHLNDSFLLSLLTIQYVIREYYPCCKFSFHIQFKEFKSYSSSYNKNFPGGINKTAKNLDTLFIFREIYRHGEYHFKFSANSKLKANFKNCLTIKFYNLK